MQYILRAEDIFLPNSSVTLSGPQNKVCGDIWMVIPKSQKHTYTHGLPITPTLKFSIPKKELLNSTERKSGGIKQKKTGIISTIRRSISSVLRHLQNKAITKIQRKTIQPKSKTSYSTPRSQLPRPSRNFPVSLAPPPYSQDPPEHQEVHFLEVPNPLQKNQVRFLHHPYPRERENNPSHHHQGAFQQHQAPRPHRQIQHLCNYQQGLLHQSRPPHWHHQPSNLQYWSLHHNSHLDHLILQHPHQWHNNRHNHDRSGQCQTLMMEAWTRQLPFGIL